MKKIRSDQIRSDQIRSDRPSLRVDQPHPSKWVDLAILELIQYYFGNTGNISKQGKDSVEKIMPFVRRTENGELISPLQGVKHLDFF